MDLKSALYMYKFFFLGGGGGGGEGLVESWGEKLFSRQTFDSKAYKLKDWR